jgi:hypothetical protein
MGMEILIGIVGIVMIAAGCIGLALNDGKPDSVPFQYDPETGFPIDWDDPSVLMPWE